ncbi:MAG: DUF4340 domain-containing protein [Gammaproteobacteria bacterium]
MNNNTLRNLAIAAVILTVIALLVSLSDNNPERTSESLIPGLEARINEINSIEVFSAGDELVVKLVPSENGWISDTNGGYPADIGRVRRNVIALAEANIEEQKTAQPENYSRLGVEDISDASASGVMISLNLPDESHRIILGDSGVSGGAYSYARLAGEAQSVLVSGTFDVSKSVEDWLDISFLDISSAEIQSIQIQHPDGETLSIAKMEPDDTDFRVENIPPNRELNYAGVANTLGSVLSSLDLLDVGPAEQFDAGDTEPVIAIFNLFDGTVITAKTWQEEDNVKHAFSATVDEKRANAFVADTVAELEASGENAESDADTIAAIVDAENITLSAIQQGADELNEQLTPWIYSLPAYKWEQLVRRMEDLLKNNSLPGPPQ